MAGACSASASSTAQAVVARQSPIEVALFALGRDAGGGATAHHVDHHDRHFGGDCQTDTLGHQCNAGSGGGCQRRHAAKRGADDHVDRCQLILGLDQCAAGLGQRRRHPFEQFGGRCDRIGGDETHAAAQGAKAGRLVAGDLPASGMRPRCGAWLTQPRKAGDIAGRLHARAQRLQVGIERSLAAFPSAAQRCFQAVHRKPGQCAGDTQRQHVDPAAGHCLGHLLERQRYRACAAGQEYRWHRFTFRAADHQAIGMQRNLVGKAVHVEPVDRQQQIEPVVQRFQWPMAQAQQRGRLATANLRAAGTHHQPIEAGARGGVEQQGAGGHDAAAAAAGNGNRQAGSAVAGRWRHACGQGRVQHRGFGSDRGVHGGSCALDAFE